MSIKKSCFVNRPLRGYALVALLCLISCAILTTQAQAFTLSVEDPAGARIASYKWVVEEDVTIDVTPGVLDPERLSTNFHRSYMPVVATGNERSVRQLNSLDPTKRYFISVLPGADYSMGGAQVKANQASVKVLVQPLPIPTAQVSVFVFHDNAPLNNSPDLPAEVGLEGFAVQVTDAGGKYGVSGGPMLYDAFGNLLGTEYEKNPDGSYAIGPDGAPVVSVAGNGEILTDANGFAIIKNLPPGKWSITIDPPDEQSPPPGSEQAKTWFQTTTIEGTRVIDAWVKANESTVFAEFGFPSTHVFFGFTKLFSSPDVLTGGSDITGRVVNFHFGRPPDVNQIFPGHPLGEILIGLNAGGRAVYAGKANADGTFTIPNVPPGSYELVVWDIPLDRIISFFSVVMPAPAAPVALGDIPVPDWFAHLEGKVFTDLNENGFPNAGEAGVDNQAVNLRFRDGTVYQATSTDSAGFYALDEIFPFFHWLVAEVDFLRYKATGATIVVDAGGKVPVHQGWKTPSFNKLTPQPQTDVSGAPIINPVTANNLSRTETGEVLVQGIQDFAGQTNVIYWGKRDYNTLLGENGGISGIVFYDVTRAEDDPRYNAGEPWTPGIPRVQVNLYQDSDNNQVIDDVNAPAGTQLADVDNHPLGWADGGIKGVEDIDRNGNDVFDQGDAIAVTWTDSWDDSLPEGCPGNPADEFYLNAKCYDGWRNFNQVRPGVFDGGYAFPGYNADTGEGLQPGVYIVEVGQILGATGRVTLKTVKSQDINVAFGETFTPSLLALPPVCVGPEYVVPPELSLFPGEPAPLAGQTLRDCNRKQAVVTPGRNMGVDFFKYTDAPITAHYTGGLTNDLGNEGGRGALNFGEKFGAPFVPVAFRDWTGKEITRIYSDENGKYNGLLPSTFTANVGNPSGFSPAMYSVCINDAGPIFDEATGQFILDPFFRREFTQSCFTFQFMPGSTTYLDTPMLPTQAFVSRQSFPLDCDYPDGTPAIFSVSTDSGPGPYVSAAGQNMTITAKGPTIVPNPAFDILNPGQPATITRDYGFGNAGVKVRLVGHGELDVLFQSNSTVVVSTAAVPAGQYQLVVAREDNKLETVSGITLTVGPWAGAVHRVPADFATIQAAVDAASPGDLILAAPGVYNELVVLWKEVQIQGSGPGATIVDGIKQPSEKLQLWKQKVEQLLANGDVDLLPNQDASFSPFFSAGLLGTEQGATFTVFGKKGAGPGSAWTGTPPARIDGFFITGGDGGGAVFVNGYADFLEITNNEIVSNMGHYGGGIRIGHPVTIFAFAGQPVDAQNNGTKIKYNYISRNGAVGGGTGGGISLYTGSDHYRVTNNYMCGNFSIGSGAGVGHLGLSKGGLIEGNLIAFNQDFHQTITPQSGGGISVEGFVPVAGLTAGSGSVTINQNRIQGNLAGAGDGGGIRLYAINGLDVQNNMTTPENWHTINIFNNMIVNNLAGLAGAGISLEDAARVNIINNTVARNDSTGTAGLALAPGFTTSAPQPAGIVSRGHSPGFLAAIAAARAAGGSGREYRVFSLPQLVNNIIYQNRSFYFDINANGGLAGLVQASPFVRDLAVLGASIPDAHLVPRRCLLTQFAGFDGADYRNNGNVRGDPMFASPYFNGSDAQIVLGNPTNPGVTIAVDEGGNPIDLSFGPLSLVGDYHILAGSAAAGEGNNNIIGEFPLLGRDYDNQVRPRGAVDIGADER